jgi:hypothetical protein
MKTDSSRHKLYKNSLFSYPTLYAVSECMATLGLKSLSYFVQKVHHEFGLSKDRRPVLGTIGEVFYISVLDFFFS